MSFQQGISGLNAASRNLEVIGNNIANANTVGGKSSRAEFSDVYANVSANQWGVSTGMGVRVSAVTQQFTQGSIRTTDNPMDMAINGRGFFRVTQPGGEAAYTRNGQFKVDDRWSAVVQQTRNIYQKQDIRLSLGVKYQDECSFFLIAYERSGARDRSLGPSDSIRFTFALTGLGGGESN